MKSENPFDRLSQDPVYLELKNHLYNFLIRKEKIRRRLNPGSIDGKILEIGSAVSPVLENERNVFYSDLSHAAMKYLKGKETSRKALTTSAEAVGLKSGSLAAVLCSEVLEHIPEDQKALDEIRRILRPGGRLILTVPLHPYLFAYDDRFVHHYRRYVLKDLLKQLEGFGFSDFKVVKLSGLLEKLTMLAAVPLFQLFSRLQNGDNKWGRFYFLNSGTGPRMRSGPVPEFKNRTAPIYLLPFYKFANRVYARIVALEAAVIPLALCTAVLITGRKKGDR